MCTHVDMMETGEFSGGQLSSVELVESDEESGVQNSSSSRLNHLHCPKSSELSHVKGRSVTVDCAVIMCHCKVSVFLCMMVMLWE